MHFTLKAITDFSSSTLFDVSGFDNCVRVSAFVCKREREQCQKHPSGSPKLTKHNFCEKMWGNKCMCVCLLLFVVFHWGKGERDSYFEYWCLHVTSKLWTYICTLKIVYNEIVFSLNQKIVESQVLFHENKALDAFQIHEFLFL